MIKFLSKALLTTVGVLCAAYLLKGVTVKDPATAMIVAVVLGLLNSFVKPIFIILTIPITVITLGFFLLVINILIVKWAAGLVPGFSVNSWFTAFLFGIIVSFVTAILEGIIGSQEKKQQQD
ncbi:MAG: phage holin family protein [Chitinophagaceae bacterium]